MAGECHHEAKHLSHDSVFIASKVGEYNKFNQCFIVIFTQQTLCFKNYFNYYWWMNVLLFLQVIYIYIYIHTHSQRERERIEKRGNPKRRI